jgi:hypothetical protein
MNRPAEEIIRDLNEVEKHNWAAQRKNLDLREELESVAACHRRSWSAKVANIARNAAKGWSKLHINAETRVTWSGHDKTRPYVFEITVSINATYCDGNRRGSLRLYGSWDEREQLLEETRRILCR